MDTVLHTRCPQIFVPFLLCILSWSVLKGTSQICRKDHPQIHNNREGTRHSMLKAAIQPQRSGRHTQGRCNFCLAHLQQFKHGEEVPSREVPTKDGVIAELGWLIVLVSELHNRSGHCGTQIFRLSLR